MYKRNTFDFAPGTAVKYCNAGYLLLSEAIRRTSGMSTRDFLEKEFFRPLGMPDTFLGRNDEDRSRISDCVLPPELAAFASNWNSDYFHRLGNPWGGLFSTVRDYARFLQMLLNGGEFRGVRIFSPATVRMMTSNHVPRLPGLSPAHRIAYAKGLGWQLRDNGDFQSMGEPGLAASLRPLRGDRLLGLGRPRDRTLHDPVQQQALQRPGAGNRLQRRRPPPWWNSAETRRRLRPGAALILRRGAPCGYSLVLRNTAGIADRERSAPTPAPSWGYSS